MCEESHDTGLIQQSPILSATDILDYSLHALKVLHCRSRHELTNQANRICEVRLGDGQVDKASDHMSEPFGSHASLELA